MKTDDSEAIIHGMLTFRNIRLAFVGIFLLIMFFSSYFVVKQYERGVVTTWGKISYLANPGLGFKIPFAQSVYRVRTDLQEVQPTNPVNTYTEDNQEIDIVFKVFYNLPPDQALYIYEHINDYENKLFYLTNDRLKAEMGKVKLEHFAEHRGDIRDRILKTLVIDAAKTLSLQVTDFQFTDVDYTPAFRKAVEQASVQKAGVETKEWERQQAEKSALTARINAEGVANAARETAKGEADAIAYKATAEARAIKLKGEATADAMSAQAKALAQNPVLVEMKKAETWDGKLPQAIYAGAPIPFLKLDATRNKKESGND
jgi:regulator of protease activity HflC (stomatin/prohibitin superfamily)